MRTPLERLKAIGFRQAGCWNCQGQRFAFDLQRELATANNILYAFVSDGKVLYIGKSVRSLRERMNSYRNPGPTQSTNIRNNAMLLDMLSGGSKADIYVLPDNGLLHYGGFHVNLAAGLEDSLIRELNPPWNGGKRTAQPDTD